jgi:hypothetical protein
MLKRLSKKQKITITAGAIVILAAFVFWAVDGFYVFTQTQVLIQRKDPLFGTTYKEWKNHFIWGLDLTLVVSFVSIVVSSVLLFLFNPKRKANK